MAVRAPVREVRRTLFEFDPSRIDAHSALRCSIGIAVPLLAGLLLGRPELGGAAAIGAWSAGLTTFHKDARPRPVLALLAGTVVGIGVMVGGYAAPFVVVSLIVTMAWCLVFGLISALSDITASVATVCGTSIIISHGLTTVSTPLMAGIAAAAGGLIQASVILLLPRHRHRSERLALAGVYHWLATEARTTADDEERPPATAPLELAERVVEDFRTSPGVFFTSLDHARRLRAVITAVGAARARLVDADPTAARHIAGVLREAADALDAIGDAIAAREVPGPEWHERLSSAVEQVAEDNKATYLPVPEYEANRLLSLVRAAAATAATPTVEHARRERMDAPRWRLVPDVPPLRDMVAEAYTVLRANLTWRSTALRHALRTSLAVGIATVGSWFWPGDHYWWLPLTAWLILKADFAATLGKGMGRALGTGIGALVAGLLSFLVPGSTWSIAPLVIGFALISYLLFQASFLAFSASVSAFVVFNLELGGTEPISAAGQRVAATIVGGVFALLFFLAWPKWETPLLGGHLADLTERYAAYADLVLGRHADPSRRKEGKLRERLDELRLSRAETEAAIKKAAAEPVTAPGPMSADADAIAKSLGWAARPMIVLEAHLPPVDALRLRQVDAFRSAVAEAYRRIAARLRGAEADEDAMRPLRDAYDRMVTELADDAMAPEERQPTARRRALYRWEGDVLADALENTYRRIRG